MASITQLSVSALGTASVRLMELLLSTNRAEVVQSSQFLTLETQARLFSSGYNKIEVNLYTKEVAAGDRRRDLALSSLYNHVRFLQNAPIPEVAQAAKRVYSVLKAQGIASAIAAMKMGDESQAVRKVLTNVAAQVTAADIATLNLAPWIDELTNAQTDFEAIYVRRSDENASEADIASATNQRRNLENAIRGVEKFVDSMATISPDPFWRELYNRFEERLNELARGTGPSKPNADPYSKE